MTDWLPSLIQLGDYGGDWEAYLKAVHRKFQDDFVHRRLPDFRGQRMSVKRHPIVNGLEATFWHFISEGSTGEDNRTPDLRRCERIAWPRPIIEAVDSGRIRVWPTLRRGRELRMVLAVEDFSYVVVLAVREDYVLPWTAYAVEHEHRRRKLRRDYQRFQQDEKR